MRSPERQATWLAGRILAKQLLRERLAAEPGKAGTDSPRELHIESRSITSGLGTRPTVRVKDRWLEWGLSIAHSSRGVLVALVPGDESTVGVDLASTDNGGSLAWCFSAAERRWLAALPMHGRGAERLWAMKEAIFKACKQGEGFAPQRIEIVADGQQLHAAGHSVRALQSSRVDTQIAALAGRRSPPADYKRPPFEILREPS